MVTPAAGWVSSGSRNQPEKPVEGFCPVLPVEVAGVLQGLLRRDVDGGVDVSALDVEVAVHHVLLLDAVGVVLDARRDHRTPRETRVPR